jgi:hypothetical protein
VIEQKKTDYLIIFFSVLVMLGVGILGILLLSSCSLSFHRQCGQIEGNHAAKTDFVITTKG